MITHKQIKSNGQDLPSRGYMHVFSQNFIKFLGCLLTIYKYIYIIITRACVFKVRYGLHELVFFAFSPLRWLLASLVTYIRCLGHIHSLHSKICRESHERVLDTYCMHTPILHLRIYVIWITFHVWCHDSFNKNTLSNTFFSLFYLTLGTKYLETLRTNS